jgi:GNAT superfamily N-acetyltransferase
MSQNATVNYVIRPYLPGDEEEIVQLLQLVFERWPHFDLSCAATDHWKWKFKDNPLKKSIISVGTIDDKIISCTHMIPLRIKIGDSVFLCGNGYDLAVHPDFRRIGIAKKMNELRKELRANAGIKFTIMVPGNSIMVKHYLKLYSRFPYTVLNFVRIRDIDWHLQMIPSKNVWLKKYGFYLVRALNQLRDALRVSNLPNEYFRISKIHSFDGNLEVFWDEIKDHYTFIVERTRDYLNWRYCDSRGGNYILKIAEADGQVLGYSVLRIDRHVSNYPVGYIVDLLALPERLGVTDALVADAIDYFTSNGVNMIRCQVVKDHPHERILKGYGFLNIGYGIDIFYDTYATICEELDKLQTRVPGRIHFVYGDYDWV